MIFNNLFIALAVAKLVSCHGVITKAVGNMGGIGNALGVVSSTPRDGSRQDPFQLDSTVFGGANADACGETTGGGPNIPAEQITKVVFENNGLPKVSPGGMLFMTLHQVNGDGAGPYDCQIDSSGTGTGGWTKIDVINNVPGRKSRSKAKATDFPLIAMIPENQKCTGNAAGKDNLCIVRCKNKAEEGPFGGCVPVTMISVDGASKINGSTETREGDEEKEVASENEPNEKKESSERREVSEKNESAGIYGDRGAPGKQVATKEPKPLKRKEVAGANIISPPKKSRTFHS